jgi:hypothetical protein
VTRGRLLVVTVLGALYVVLGVSFWREHGLNWIGFGLTTVVAVATILFLIKGWRRSGE